MRERMRWRCPKKNHKNIRSETTHNNSHLITPSRSQSVRRDNETAFGCSTKWSLGEKDSQERKEEEKKNRNTHGKYVRKQTTNMNQELKLKFINADRLQRQPQEHTHLLVHTCECIEHARLEFKMRANILGAASLHNRSHLSILFACHIPYILKNQIDPTQIHTHTRTHPASDC